MRIVAIDEGHGGKDSGAVSVSGVFESVIVEQYAPFTQFMLLGLGLDVKRIRLPGESVASDERIRRIKASHADCLVSLHCNSVTSEKATGFEVYTSPGITPADALAESVITELMWVSSSLRGRFDIRDGDRDKEAHFYVLTRSPMPAILVEFGFLSNVADERLILDPLFRHRACSAITVGVARWIFGMAT